MQKRIAIVEDDNTIRANYSDALKRQGYAVTGYAERASATAGHFQTEDTDSSISAIRLSPIILVNRGQRRPERASF